MSAQTGNLAAVERVTYRPEGGRARTIYLANVQETTVAGAPVICGVELDRDGNSVQDVKGQAVERRHLIETALIVKRTPVVMDRIYGEWVDA